jgi:hypothetical protein
MDRRNLGIGSAVFGALVMSLTARLGAEAADAEAIECRRATTPVVIDGRADEPCWKGAPTIKRFCAPFQPGNPAARFGTQVRLVWDDDGFYFHAEMKDDDLFADVIEQDGRHGRTTCSSCS